MAQFTATERRILLLNFSATHPATTRRRSRLLGYTIFGGQVAGLIIGILASGGSEHSILPGMFGGLFFSLAISYFIFPRLDRAALRAFIARSSRPIIPLTDRVAIIAYHGKPPKT